LKLLFSDSYSTKKIQYKIIRWWPVYLPEPEWIGVYIATYIAMISTLSFCASINEECGEDKAIAADTIYVELTDDNYMYKLRHGKCSVYAGDAT
jgi:hypothetical protein